MYYATLYRVEGVLLRRNFSSVDDIAAMDLHIKYCALYKSNIVLAAKKDTNILNNVQYFKIYSMALCAVLRYFVGRIYV